MEDSLTVTMTQVPFLSSLLSPVTITVTVL
jgi:hypothetical protein